jgi:hydroxymethylglutaryl-CoA lyase
LGFPYSVSETFLKRNQNQTAEENYEVLEAIYKKTDEAGLDMVVYISMAFGNPYGDPWSIDEVMAAMENISDLGVLSISLADTVGIATPEQVATLAREAVERFEGFDTGVHLHSRSDDAAAKVLSAYDAGIRRFDSTIGGIGGCPFASDKLVGNIPTEIVIQALESRGIGVPIRKSLDKLIAMSQQIATEYS